MVRELEPKAQIQLIVDAETEHRVSFDETALRELRSWWLNTLTELPQRQALQAESIATPGPACWHCPVRHVCGSYIAKAPVLWRQQGESAPMPFDTWGELSSIEDFGTWCDIRLVDAAGRKVKISRVARRHLALREGPAKLWFFGLAPSGVRTHNGLWTHPRNFHEVLVDASERTAWALKVFSS